MRGLLNGSEGLVSVSLRDFACSGVMVFDWHFVPDSGSVSLNYVFTPVYRSRVTMWMSDSDLNVNELDL